MKLAYRTLLHLPSGKYVYIHPSNAEFWIDELLTRPGEYYFRVSTSGSRLTCWDGPKAGYFKISEPAEFELGPVIEIEPEVLKNT